MNTRRLYNEYIKSLCISDTNLAEFKTLGDLKAEMIWLEKHCKKKELIFYLRSLLYGDNNNDYIHRVYEKDATSSGLQIISILLRDLSLAKESNVVGNEVKDIYSDFADICKKRLAKTSISWKEV